MSNLLKEALTNDKEWKNLSSTKNLSELTNSLFEGIYSVPEIEDLQESYIIMKQESNKNCCKKNVGGMEETAKSKNEQKVLDLFCCDWYHGTWQIMRLLNMVAVPRWYPFYKEALNKELMKRPNARVMISACADYGMLHTLHDSIKSTDTKPTIVIYDICKTPLISSQWYADKNNLSLELHCENIITSNIGDKFDIIVTDEFLSVLQDPYKPLITEKWHKLLNQDGAIVTTAMVGVPTTQEHRNYYRDKAFKRFDHYKDILFNRSSNNADDFHSCFEKFSQYHTRHMISDEKQIKSLFSGFDSLSLEIVKTPGECVNPTYSYQIVARK